MVRILAVLFGIAFIFMGVVGGGVFPRLIQNGLLYGYFSVDAMHNLVYLATGAASLIAAINRTVSKAFFILFGLGFAAIAGMGVARQGDIYFMHNALFDNYLFSGAAIIFLLIGLSAAR
ncbi:MAG: hypothetical protein A3F43_03135 [Gammaproteobacteria bacterium RIFCSPHIGHO2_12_FULL_42_10]|nr:MAG: hypothetical protein A3F43_03135 [Gammaproteobacteria bacterium RIFCSPHIGHO2_12_FULL_42_10]